MFVTERPSNILVLRCAMCCADNTSGLFYGPNAVPRVLAVLVVFPLLTVLADAVGVLGGMLIMFLERGADMYGYWNVPVN